MVLALIGETNAVNLARKNTTEDNVKQANQNKYVQINNHSRRGAHSMRRYKVDQKVQDDVDDKN